MIPPLLVAIGLLLIFLVLYDDRVYRIAAPIAFVLHLCVGLFILPELPYGWDIGNFHEPAIVLVEQGIWPEASQRVSAFAGFPALLYYVFGTEYASEIFIIFNSLLAVLVPIPACYVAKQLYPNVEAPIHGAMLAILFYPAPFLFMTLPMRESATIFLFFVALALVTAAFVERELWILLPLPPVWGMLYLSRPELGLVFLLGTGAALTVTILDRAFDRDLSFAAICVALSPFAIIGFRLFTEMFAIDSLESERSWRAQGGAAYLEGASYETWFDVLLSAPVRALYFQYAPFPSQIESTFHLLGAISLPILIFLTIAAYRSALRCRTDQRLFALLITVYLAGIVGYGLVNSNFGTTIRHRIPFEFLLVMFATPVFARWEKSITKRLSQRPDEESDDDEHHRETHKLHRDV